MARFGAAIRARGDLPAVSMKDVYLHPSIRRLAAALSATGSSPATEPAPATAPAATPAQPGTRGRRGSERGAAPAGTLQYLLCGVLQLLAFAGYVALASVWLNAGLGWVMAGHGIAEVYARAAVIGGGGLLVVGTLPIAAKWALIGRWRPRRIRVWSLAYFRFWVVKTLVVGQPAGAAVRRHPAVRPVPAGAGRQGRPRRGHLHPARAGVHRPAEHRARRGDPQGLLPQRLPRAGRCDRDRPGHRRRGRLRRRADGPGHRHRPGRRGPARARLRAAHRAGGPGRARLARLPGPARRSRLQLPDRRARPAAAPCAGAPPPPPGCCWRSPSSGRWRQPPRRCCCTTRRCSPGCCPAAPAR